MIWSGSIFVACYSSLFWLLYKPVIPKLSAAASNSFRNLDKHQKRIWSENAVSTIHAVVVFLLSVWNLLFDKVTLEEPVLGAGWAVTHLAAIAAAFMIVDTGIMLSVGDRSVFFYFHHLSVAFACMFCLIEGRFCPWFSSLKSLSEASTPFVHANWFLKVTGVSESSVLSKLLTYIVFTLCRIFVIPFFWFYAYVYWDEGWSISKTWILVLASSLALDLLNIRWWLQMTSKFVYFIKCKLFCVSYDDKKHELSSAMYCENPEKKKT